MKQIIICLLFMLATIASFCQEMKSSHPLTREEYLSKSKNQRTAAKVLLIGGGALIGITAILASNKETSFDEAGTYAVLAGIGIVASLTSIPLFIAANRNRKKAKNATAGLKMERGLYSYSYPALTFKISL